MAILRPVMQKFLNRYPFSSTKVISRYFRISPPTVKEILRRALGLKQFSRGLVLHLHPDDRTKSRIDASEKLLSMLGMYAKHYFEGIGTGGES
jgi:hypothetical protein